MFEEARLKHSCVRPNDALMEIAEVHISAGDAETALSYIDRIPEHEASHMYGLDTLRIAINMALGKV
jgi:hypothetical protein